MEIETVDLNSEQLKYIRTLLLTDLLTNQRTVRSREFAKYGPVEAARLHEDIRIASALVATLPQPRPYEAAILPERFRELAAI